MLYIYIIFIYLLLMYLWLSITHLSVYLCIYLFVYLSFYPLLYMSAGYLHSSYKMRKLKFFTSMIEHPHFQYGMHLQRPIFHCHFSLPKGIFFCLYLYSCVEKVARASVEVISWLIPKGMEPAKSDSLRAAVEAHVSFFPVTSTF